MLRNDNAVLVMVDFQVRMMPAINHHEELLENVVKFAKGCRVLDVQTLVTQQYTKGLGDTMPEIKEALGECEYVEKISFSCCGSDEFTEKLKNSGKKNVLVTGIEAHICVQQTVLDLLNDGYNVYLIVDCIGSRTDRNRLYGERRMEQAGAVLTTMESVLFEMLERADHPKRKEITAIVK